VKQPAYLLDLPRRRRSSFVVLHSFSTSSLAFLSFSSTSDTSLRVGIEGHAAKSASDHDEDLGMFREERLRSTSAFEGDGGGTAKRAEAITGIVETMELVASYMTVYGRS
jgi:hypothetical protein